jgi:MFS transporter, DHA3 family, macrolide efflux protein
MVILGLSFGVLGLLPGTWFSIALGSSFLAGLMIPFIDGPINAILQATVAPEMQGRVFTMVGSLISITSPFSLSIAGPVSDALGLQMWYVVAGVLCGMIGLAGFFIPALVGIEENAGTAAVRDETLAPVEVEI